MRNEVKEDDGSTDPDLKDKQSNNILTRINKLRNFLMQRNKQEREYEITREDNKNKAETTDLQIGDVVYRVKQPIERLNKLDSKYTGPYKVIRKNTAGSYAIQGPELGVRILNRKDLKLVTPGKEDLKEGGM